MFVGASAKMHRLPQTFLKIPLVTAGVPLYKNCPVPHAIQLRIARWKKSPGRGDEPTSGKSSGNGREESRSQGIFRILSSPAGRTRSRLFPASPGHFDPAQDEVLDPAGLSGGIQNEILAPPDMSGTIRNEILDRPGISERRKI